MWWRAHYRAYICHKYHKLYLWRKIVMWRNFGKLWDILGDFATLYALSCGVKLSPKSTFVEKKWQIWGLCMFHLVITGGWALPLHVEGPVGRLRLLQAGPRLRAGHVLHRRHPPSQPRGGWSFHRLCQPCEPSPTCSFLQGNRKILDNITLTLLVLGGHSCHEPKLLDLLCPPLLPLAQIGQVPFL